MLGHVKKKLKKDPLNIEVVHVPWVEDWFRTRQGYARINLIAEKTKLTPDEVQSKFNDHKISHSLDVACRAFI